LGLIPKNLRNPKAKTPLIITRTGLGKSLHFPHQGPVSGHFIPGKFLQTPKNFNPKKLLGPNFQTIPFQVGHKAFLGATHHRGGATGVLGIGLGHLFIPKPLNFWQLGRGLGPRAEPNIPTKGSYQGGWGFWAILFSRAQFFLGFPFGGQTQRGGFGQRVWGAKFQTGQIPPAKPKPWGKQIPFFIPAKVHSPAQIFFPNQFHWGPFGTNNFFFNKNFFLQVGTFNIAKAFSPGI